jgi:hypothetical protein
MWAEIITICQEKDVDNHVSIGPEGKQIDNTKLKNVQCLFHMGVAISEGHVCVPRFKKVASKTC